MTETTTMPRARPAGASARIADRTEEASSPTFLIYLMVFSMLPPIRFTIAGAELFPLRLLVLALFVPFLFRLLNGSLGRFRAVDGFVLACSAWTFISLLINHGLTRLPLATVTVTDIFGGYLLGRALIRSPADFRVFIKAMIAAALVMLPFALLEFVTNYNMLQKLFSPVFDTFHKGRTSYGRLGFERVMAGFAHPILYGFFCSLAVATTYFTFRSRKGLAIVLAGFFLFMTFMSLSSGPFLSAVVQMGLITWGKITNGAWRFLAWMSAIGYVVVDLLSNRTPITIAINYITFNSDTAWYRVAQWRYGMDVLKANPLFGIGLGEWDRPNWLGASIDNFWLLNAMRYGIPSFVFIALALFFLIRGLVRLQALTEEAARMRLGFIITLIGVILTLATVHVWGAAGIFTMAFLGMGVWLFDAENWGRGDRAPDPAGEDDTTSGADTSGPRSKHRRRDMPRAEPPRRIRRSATPMVGRGDRRN